jgi:hypothetical protein
MISRNFAAALVAIALMLTAGYYSAHPSPPSPPRAPPELKAVEPAPTAAERTAKTAMQNCNLSAADLREARRTAEYTGLSANYVIGLNCVVQESNRR